MWLQNGSPIRCTGKKSNIGPTHHNFRGKDNHAVPDCGLASLTDYRLRRYAIGSRPGYEFGHPMYNALYEFGVVLL